MPHQDTNGLIRKLSAADLPQFRDHLLRLDPEARRSRFAMAASDAFITSYAVTSFNLKTVIHGYFVDGVLRAVAEMRPVGDDKTAEAAFSVEGSWQHSGIGTRLMELTLIAARNRGIEHVFINCLASNRAMQLLARKFEAELTFEAGDVIGRLAASQPSVFSLLRENLADGFGLFETLIGPARKRPA